ncbi:MAG TPA: peptide chain release factor aRF-1 [Acidobacteriota bacterium]|nr:peptide chain release factor aRF-1 [Acidobacteriota bacterium]
MTQVLNAKEKHELKKLIKQLKQYRGSHTELVTVYVPAEYDLTKVINQLIQEQGTASNIKSASTRNNVTDALERMIQHLRLHQRTPPHGLAAFSGNVAEREGQSDIRVFSVEPPIPLNVRIYRCDKQFITEPLEEMMDFDNIYALVVLDRRDGCIALLKGSKIQVLVKTHSEVPGKTRAGGQSSLRFARQREGAAKEHYRKIAEYMKEQLLPLKNLKGIIIGGPGVTINDFMNESQLTGELQKKVLGTKDLGYTDEFGLQELLDKSQDLLSAEAVADEKKYMQRFLEMLAKDEKKVAYGRDEVRKMLELGAVDLLMISESLDDTVIDEYNALAEAMGTKIMLITVDTREGEQLRELGKFAAILRYAVER